MKHWTYRIKYNGSPVFLIPHACVHFDSPSHDRKLFIEFLKELQSSPNNYTIGLGDYIDFLRTTWRESFKQARLNASIHRTIDETVRRICDDYIGIVRKYCPDFSKKCMGYHLGNHSWDFLDGLNVERYICFKLHLQYLSIFGNGRLTIERNNGKRNKGSSLVLTILSHHGHNMGSGGWAAGSSVASMERRTARWGHDIKLMAHNHRLEGERIQVLDAARTGSPRLLSFDKVLLRAGCFLKSYIGDSNTKYDAPDPGTYADSCLYPPNVIGYGRIKMTWKQGSSIAIPRPAEKLVLEVQT